MQRTEKHFTGGKNDEKIEKWLEENGIKYTINQYGNPYYFDDGFSVSGIAIAFYFDDIGNNLEDRKKLENYMSRKKSYKCICERFGSGYSYRIMTVFDATRLEDHENKVKAAVDEFWKKEHARRTQKTA